MNIDVEKLKKLREGRGWSQQQLAEAAGISVRTVQRAERDGVASRETKICLAAALDVPHGELEAPEQPRSPAAIRAAPMPSAFERALATYYQSRQLRAANAVGIAAGTFVFSAVAGGLSADLWYRSAFVGGFVFVLLEVLVKQARKSDSARVLTCAPDPNSARNDQSKSAGL